MGLNNDISRLIDLSIEENKSYRFDNSDEYKEVYNRVDDKSIIIDCMEEELSIDLITLFKAFTKGIWAKKRDEIVFVKAENLRFEGKIDCGEPLLTVFVFKELYYEDLDCVMDTTGYEWELEDYGKTWALTKEELESSGDLNE